MNIDASASWRISVYSIVEHDGKILMIMEQGRDVWELPGGGIAVDETLRNGIVREVFEETGYYIVISSDQPVYLGETSFFHPREKQFFHSLNPVFVAQLASTEQDKNITSSPEHAAEIKQIAWHEPQEISEKNCHDFIYPAIQAYRSFKKQQTSS